MVELRIMGENHSKTNLGLVLGRNNSIKTTIFFSACVILDKSLELSHLCFLTLHTMYQYGGCMYGLSHHIQANSIVWVHSKPPNVCLSSLEQVDVISAEAEL